MIKYFQETYKNTDFLLKKSYIYLILVIIVKLFKTENKLRDSFKDVYEDLVKPVSNVKE